MDLAERPPGRLHQMGQEQQRPGLDCSMVGHLFFLFKGEIAWMIQPLNNDLQKQEVQPTKHLFSTWKSESGEPTKGLEHPEHQGVSWNNFWIR